MAVEISEDRVRELGKIAWPHSWTQDTSVARPLDNLRRQLEAEHARFVGAIYQDLASEAEALLKAIRLRLRVRYQGLYSHARERSGSEFYDSARNEFRMLAEQVREIVLARAARPSKVSWVPTDTVDRIETLFEALPPSVRLVIPNSVYAPRESDGLSLAVRRISARSGAQVKRMLGRPNQRRVPLKSMVVWHIRKALGEGLEGAAVLLVQAEADLQARAFNIYQLATREIEAIIADSSDALGKLTALWEEFRSEVARAEREIGRFVEDAAARMSGVYVAAFRQIESELETMATFRLSPAAREGESLGPGFSRSLSNLERRLAESRSSVAESYFGFALRVELSSFRVRARQELESKIRELESVVRGRLLKQLERLHTELNFAVETLSGGQEKETKELSDRSQKNDLPLPEAELFDQEELEKVVERVARVLKDARKAAKPGIDAVSSASALGTLLEDLAIEAQELTDQYQVPERRLPKAEWTLPRIPASVTVPFAQLVATFIETDIAPKLLNTVTNEVSSLEELQDIFDEVARVTRLSGEQIEFDEVDDVLGFDVETTDRSLTRVVLLKAFQEVRGRVEEVERRVEAWSAALAGPLRRELRIQLDRLEQGFGDQELSHTVAGAKTRLARASRADSQGSGRGFRWFLSSSPARVKEAVRDQSFDSVKRALGLAVAKPEAGSIALLSPLRVPSDVPLYYRRLFAPLGAWVSDVLLAAGDGAELFGLFGGGFKGRIRAAAVIGVEPTERRAIISSLTRGERFRNVKSVHFTEPTGAESVRRALASDGPDGPVVISGLSWLLSSSRHGFDGIRALCDVILEDSGRSRYLVDADTTVWDWARTAAPLDELFVQQLQVPQFSAEQLETTLSARHALSAMSLQFGAEGDEKARTRYFKRLRMASDGLLTHALLFWLASISAVEEGPPALVRVGELPVSPFELVRDLPEDTLHTAYLVARQGWMTPSILASLLGRRETAAEGMLSKMVGLGLLERTSDHIYLQRRHLGSAFRRAFQERAWV